MPNDAPDWSVTPTTPAISQGTFTAPASATTTFGPFTTTPGTHAVKLYIRNTLAVLSGLTITLEDATTGQDIASWAPPRSVTLFAPLDDQSVPSYYVTVTVAPPSGLVQLTVLDMLSDQAVAVDNDAGDPIPVELVGVETAIPDGSTTATGILVASFPYGSGGTVPINSTLAAGANVVLLPAVSLNVYHPLRLTLGSVPPATSCLVAFETTSGVLIATAVFFSGAVQPVWIFDFGQGDGGVIGDGIRLRNTGAVSIQLAGALTYVAGPF